MTSRKPWVTDKEVKMKEWKEGGREGGLVDSLKVARRVQRKLF